MVAKNKGKKKEKSKDIAEIKNEGLMKMVKSLHGLLESDDLEKQRQSQEHIGALMKSNKELTYQEFSIEGIRAEWVSVNRAHMKKYIILYCHGGGYSTGSRLYARTVTSKLAQATSMDVLSFDYRLAPEYPYPAALEDAMKVWNYLMLLGYGARDVILAGDSAGGNLALVMALKIKEEKRLLPRGIVLLSPWTDLASKGPSYKERKKLDPILTKEYIEKMIKAYVPAGDLKQDFISPIYGNFEGFPPTYIQVGQNEILYSDSLRLYEKMKEEKINVKMDEFPGMWHVFQMGPLKEALEAVDKIAEFIYSICR